MVPSRKPSNKPSGWTWNSAGWGFLSNVDDDGVYDEAYFDKYAGYSLTEQGRKISDMRREFVQRHLRRGPLLDVGIGCGQFLEGMNEACDFECHGCDINPTGIKWLKDRGLERRPGNYYAAATFWDSMEHIKDLVGFLRDLDADQLFISMPIYASEEAVFASKHFRPDEHYWYFTKKGLIEFFRRLNYRCPWITNFESSECGREDILTFEMVRPLTSG